MPEKLVLGAQIGIGKQQGCDCFSEGLLSCANCARSVDIKLTALMYAKAWESHSDAGIC